MKHATRCALLLGLSALIGSRCLQAESRNLSGLKAGVNLNRIQNHPDLDWTGRYRRDVSFGLLSIHPLGNGVAIQTELLFSQRGHESIWTSSDSGTGSRHTRLTCLELPCLFRLGPSGGNTLSPALLFGGYVSCLLKAQRRRNGGDFVTLQEEYRRWDLGLSAGISLGFPAGSGQMVLLDARYLHGLRNIHKQSAPTPPGYNRGFTFSCAATF